MKLLADLHTHSKHSRFFHGKDSIMSMVYKANELGLQELAITDHGFKHLFRTSKDKLYDARLTINDLNQMSKTKILLGIEANIISEDGTLDVDSETMALIDILIAGYHRMIKTDFAGYFGGQKKTDEAKEKATNAFVNAIKKYPISIVTHLDSVLSTDLFKIGKACADKGVLVEINNRHTDWNAEQMQALLSSGCSFILSSDAHCRDDIGNVDKALRIVEKYNIPTERIANIEFSYEEMTEEHRELNLLYEEFKAKQKRTIKPTVVDNEIVNEEEVPIGVSRLNENTEAELEKIAKEQGFRYVKPKEIVPASKIKTDWFDAKLAETEKDSQYETEEFLKAINNFSDSLTENQAEENQPQAFDSVEEDKPFEPEKTFMSSEKIDNQSEITDNLSEVENTENVTISEKKNTKVPKKTGKGTFLDFSRFTSDDDNK